jgi:REP element-mobilizing transposase RayT
VAKQLSFFKKIDDRFGGELLKGNARTMRPLESKFSTHVVLKAKRGGLNSPHNFLKVHQIVELAARKRGIKIYEFANAGNHLHILLKLPKRSAWAPFIREIAGRIAQVTKIQWKHKPFTRIIRGWKKAYFNVKNYIRVNFMEAHGVIDRHQLKQFQDIKDLQDIGVGWADGA